MLRVGRKKAHLARFVYYMAPIFINVRLFISLYRIDNNVNKSSPDSGFPGDAPNGDLSNGFYENLPFHGMKQPQQPHKQVSLTISYLERRSLEKTKRSPFIPFLFYLHICMCELLNVFFGRSDFCPKSIRTLLRATTF